MEHSRPSYIGDIRIEPALIRACLAGSGRQMADMAATILAVGCAWFWNLVSLFEDG